MLSSKMGECAKLYGFAVPGSCFLNAFNTFGLSHVRASLQANYRIETNAKLSRFLDFEYFENDSAINAPKLPRSIVRNRFPDLCNLAVYSGAVYPEQRSGPPAIRETSWPS